MNITRLEEVFEDALAQVTGKGLERHGSEGEPFEDQIICEIGRRFESVDGELFQVIKKTYEAQRFHRRGQPERAIHELRGAMVYAAAAILLLEERISIEEAPSR